MKAPELGYKRAESVGQVIELLASYGDDARVLAGGQSLMPTLNMRLSKPKLLVELDLHTLLLLLILLLSHQQEILLILVIHPLKVNLMQDYLMAIVEYGQVDIEVVLLILLSM